MTLLKASNRIEIPSFISKVSANSIKPQQGKESIALLHNNYALIKSSSRLN